LTLRAYRLATQLTAPLAPLVLNGRLSRGKEDAARLVERRGISGVARPRGPLVWLHGASVGELVAALPLIETITARGLTMLVTTGTVTSAQLASRRLPAAAIHQFVPLDIPSYVDGFLEHWQPDLALFVESDLWPNLLAASARRAVPLVLINGRLSERSFERWRRFPKTIEWLLRCFDLCLIRSPEEATLFNQLGAPRIVATGNLKLDAPPLPVDEAAYAELAQLVRGRSVIAAASTHPGENEAMLAAHQRLKATADSLLTIIAPRHPERGVEIEQLAIAGGLRVARRSTGGRPGPDCDVYVFDTVGELGMVYRLAPIVFVGGSLIPHGGQNPVEAVHFDAALLHGPHVSNFTDIYDALDRAGAATLVADADALAERVQLWLADPTARRRASDAARATIEHLGGGLQRTLTALEPYLVELAVKNRGAHA
jgi:3-deoxy-D-manno-octulosonic-acid transferase